MTFAGRAIAVLVVTAATLGAAPATSRPSGWYAVVQTSMGSFTIQLFPDQAPQTVAHFAAFAEGRMEWIDIFTGNKKTAPFYEGLAIHKVTPAQRFEAGDPTGTGHGAPLVYVPREPGSKDFSRPFRVGMTASSQQRISGVVFFVSMVAEPYLNAAHNCFGEVVEGREVVQAICTVKTDANKAPAEPVTIKHVAIERSGDPPPIPEPVRYRPPRLEPIPRAADER
jgi:peptidyl-prolyl cis-trans isomerase A (cyclophilin A)